jgi:hypothetical protein
LNKCHIGGMLPSVACCFTFTAAKAAIPTANDLTWGSIFRGNRGRFTAKATDRARSIARIGGGDASVDAGPRRHGVGRSASPGVVGSESEARRRDFGPAGRDGAGALVTPRPRSSWHLGRKAPGTRRSLGTLAYRLNGITDRLETW